MQAAHHVCASRMGCPDSHGMPALTGTPAPLASAPREIPHAAGSRSECPESRARDFVPELDPSDAPNLALGTLRQGARCTFRQLLAPSDAMHTARCPETYVVDSGRQASVATSLAVGSSRSPQRAIRGTRKPRFRRKVHNARFASSPELPTSDPGHRVDVCSPGRETDACNPRRETDACGPGYETGAYVPERGAGTCEPVQARVHRTRARTRILSGSDSARRRARQKRPRAPRTQRHNRRRHTPGP